MTERIFWKRRRRGSTRLAATGNPAIWLASSARAVVALSVCALTTPASPAPASEVAAPTRIVSLAPAITETIFALGLGSRVVGVSTYCDYPSEAASLPKVGTFSEPVAEAIVALRPDLVLTSPSPGNETAVRAIERTGVRVAVVHSEGGIAEARNAMLDIARNVGAADDGKQLVATIDARLAAIRARAATLPHPRAIVVIGREPLVVAGSSSYLGELLELAGGINVAASIGGRWPRIGMEYLVVAAPEVLIDLSSAMAGESARAEIPAAPWSGIASVPAVANGRVFQDQASLMLRPGPRLADAADAIFAALHADKAVASPAKAPASAAATVKPGD